MHAASTHTSVRRAGDALCALTFVFLIALVPYLTCFGAASAVNVEREFRRPAPPPKRPETFDALMLWPATFDAWYRDHFGMRSSFIRWHNLAKMELFDVSPSSEIVLGRDKWMFTTRDHAVDVFRGADPMPAREVGLWAQILKERGEWCAQRKIAYLFAIAPNKESIYPEQFAPRFDVIGPTRREQVVDFSRAQADVPLLDLTDALLRAKRELVQFGAVYYPYGTHWNDLGVSYANDELVRRLATHAPRIVPLPPQINPLPLDAMSFRWTDFQDDTWAGRLYVDDLYLQPNFDAQFTRRIPAEAWERLRVFKLRKAPQREGNEHFYEDNRRYQAESARFEIVPLDGEPQGWRITITETRHVTTDIEGLDTPRVVMFHDSMGEKLQPFFAESFAHVEFRWLPDFDAEYIERARPDIVVQLAVERTFAAVALSSSPLDTQERLAREFAASQQVVLSGAEALAGLAPQQGSATTLAPGVGGALVASYAGPGLLVPEFSTPPATWPVLRLEFDAPQDTTLLAEFLTDRFSEYSRQARSLQRQVRAGRNVLFIKLRVAGLTGRLRLGLGNGLYVLQSLEVRAVPE